MVHDGDFLISCEYQASNSFCAIDLKRSVKFLSTNLSHEMQYLVEIRIYNCSVMSIKENKGLSKLKDLYLPYNKIENVANDAFVDLISLELLALSYNRIRSFSKRTFAALRALKELQLNNNEIQFLHPTIFESLINIAVIHLHRNKISDLDENIFNDLDNLEHIDLSGNKLEKVPRKLFKNNLNLRKIFLRRNQIKFIDGDAFDHLPNLEIVDLHSNLCVNKNYSSTGFGPMREDLAQECSETLAQEKLDKTLKELRIELNGELKNTKDTLQTLNETYEALVNRLKSVNDTSIEFISTSNALSFILMFCIADFIIALVMFVVYKYSPRRIRCSNLENISSAGNQI